MDSPKAVSKLLVVCDGCGKRLAVDATLAGRSIKCPCGKILTVTGGQSSSAASQTSTTPAVTTKQTAPVATAKTKATTPVRHQPSFLDQLTEADYSRPATNPYAPPASNNVSDAVMLRKYAGTEAAKAEESKTAKTNIAFLAVLNCFGAIGFLVLAVLVLVLSNMLSAMANVLPLAALGTLFAGILIGFGFFDLISGIGLIMRTFWGWWLCIVGLGWSIFDRGSGVAIRFMHAPDWTVEIAPAIGEMLVMFSAFYFLSFMCKKNTMKMFKVDVHAGIAWTVALSFGLILGGVGFGIAISAIRSLQSTP